MSAPGPRTPDVAPVTLREDVPEIPRSAAAEIDATTAPAGRGEPPAAAAEGPATGGETGRSGGPGYQGRNQAYGTGVPWTADQRGARRGRYSSVTSRHAARSASATSVAVTGAPPSDARRAASPWR